MTEAIQRQSMILTPEELFEITRYRRPGDQLAELHRRGFHRAVRHRNGDVLLERAHYEAVCRGAVESPRPKVKPPALREMRAQKK